MENDERAAPLARDTIAAIATPPGRGGIGVVRVSGPRVPEIARSLLGGLPRPRLASVSEFRNRRGEVVDEGLALYFPAPNSYTGEAVLELHGHGGPMVLQQVLEACLDEGARLAEPGEFTRRAFLEGKLDLAQAEAVADLIDAASREAARSALRSLSGEFSAAVKGLVVGVTELRALIEAMLDFPEEEVDAVYRRDADARLRLLRQQLDRLLAQSQQGRLLASGIHVVIAGRPNVGKSSLLNRIAGIDRAIVTPVAGTTRDALREPMEIRGVPITLVDTAGLHASPDVIERMGMQRTRHELAQADVVLAVVDASGDRNLPEDLPAGTVRIEVCNKVDLVADFVPPEGAIAVSARSGQGIEALKDAIVGAAGWQQTGETAFLARTRHLRALEAAAGHLEAATRAAGWEFFAEELRLAQVALSSITGEVSADDLLGEIFARFCIGK
ncbi:MAG TPA: tRNA uridine-5-carboxymethylaminomethyl(34) synthesis GTPase MnmE [Burkholderiales bacterium]|nr:tRNA uridine-5-carboxymethylaminomethyl(34) synthesis GTPase MnmE [Burkholderiales bacterium]